MEAECMEAASPVPATCHKQEKQCLSRTLSSAAHTGVWWGVELPAGNAWRERVSSMACISNKRYAQGDLLTALTGNGKWDVGKHWAKIFLQLNKQRQKQQKAGAPGPGFAQAEQCTAFGAQFHFTDADCALWTLKGGKLGWALEKWHWKSEIALDTQTGNNSVWGTGTVESEGQIPTYWRNKILALQLAPTKPYPSDSFCSCVPKAMHNIFDWRGFFKVIDKLTAQWLLSSQLFIW